MYRKCMLYNKCGPAPNERYLFLYCFLRKDYIQTFLNCKVLRSKCYEVFCLLFGIIVGFLIVKVLL